MLLHLTDFYSLPLGLFRSLLCRMYEISSNRLQTAGGIYNNYEEEFDKSLIYIIKYNVGLKTDPCGTPVKFYFFQCIDVYHHNIQIDI